MYALICKIASFRGTNKPKNSKPKKLDVFLKNIINFNRR